MMMGSPAFTGIGVADVVIWLVCVVVAVVVGSAVGVWVIGPRTLIPDIFSVYTFSKATRFAPSDFVSAVLHIPELSSDTSTLPYISVSGLYMVTSHPDLVVLNGFLAISPTAYTGLGLALIVGGTVVWGIVVGGGGVAVVFTTTVG
jgi:hypothetical protein